RKCVRFQKKTTWDWPLSHIFFCTMSILRNPMAGRAMKTGLRVCTGVYRVSTRVSTIYSQASCLTYRFFNWLDWFFFANTELLGAKTRRFRIGMVIACNGQGPD